MKDTGKIYIIIAALLLSLTGVAQKKQNREYTAEEKKIVENFNKTIEITRDRIDILQANAELSEVKYFEEEEVIQEAEQIQQLISDGHYVEISKLEAWINRLNNLAKDKSTAKNNVRKEAKSTDRWNSSLERSEKAIASGKETVKSGRERIKAAREKVEQLRKDGIINARVYNERISLIERAKRKIDSLETNITKQEMHQDSIRQRGDKISKEGTKPDKQ